MSDKYPLNPSETGPYPLVLRAVHSGQFDEASEGDLVSFVREEYLSQMKRLAKPLPESSKKGIDQEIRDSLKAITYGFFSVKEYNQKRKGSV